MAGGIARVDHPPAKGGLNMERWRTCWRKGVAPALSRYHLEALRTALTTDDARLIQEATTEPPYTRHVANWPVQAACPLALCGWLGEGLQTVSEVEEFFGAICQAID